MLEFWWGFCRSPTEDSVKILQRIQSESCCGFCRSTAEDSVGNLQRILSEFCWGSGGIMLTVMSKSCWGLWRKPAEDSVGVLLRFLSEFRLNDFEYSVGVHLKFWHYYICHKCLYIVNEFSKKSTIIPAALTDHNQILSIIELMHRIDHVIMTESFLASSTTTTANPDPIVNRIQYYSRSLKQKKKLINVANSINSKAKLF